MRNDKPEVKCSREIGRRYTGLIAGGQGDENLVLNLQN